MTIVNSKLIALSVFALSATAAFSQLVDQQDLNNNAYMAAFAQGDLAQSFTAGQNNSAGASIFTQAGIGGGASDVVTISLWNNLPNAGGTMLASGSASGHDNQWIDVFWSPVSVNVGTQYFLVFTSQQNILGISGDLTNGYAGGQTYANPGFNPFPGFDYTFKEYYNPVPEPVSMLALGLGALLIRRRRNSK